MQNTDVIWCAQCKDDVSCSGLEQCNNSVSVHNSVLSENRIMGSTLSRDFLILEEWFEWATDKLCVTTRHHHTHAAAMFRDVLHASTSFFPHSNMKAQATPTLHCIWWHVTFLISLTKMSRKSYIRLFLPQNLTWVDMNLLIHPSGINTSHWGAAVHPSNAGRAQRGQAASSRQGWQ